MDADEIFFWFLDFFSTYKQGTRGLTQKLPRHRERSVAIQKTHRVSGLLHRLRRCSNDALLRLILKQTFLKLIGGRFYSHVLISRRGGHPPARGAV